VKIIEAVTAVLNAGGEIYLVRRQPALAAFPGYHAFPGGKVDADDEAQAPGPLRRHGIAPRLLGALTRELREELGFDLATTDALRDVVQIGRALTPPIAPLRYDTHFYRIDLDARPPLAPDGDEIVEGGWAPASVWLRRYREGRLLLAPPTLMALRDLAEDPHASRLPRLEAFADGRADAIPEGILEVEPLHGLRQCLVRSNTLPPAMHTNCFLLGDEGSPRLLVDPSPADEAEYTRLARQLAGRFDAIFLTHHHSDHHECADRLARETGVPILCSAVTRRRIAARWPRFFDDLEVRTIADGEAVSRWLGRTVRALAVPGHDDGQLALLTEDRAWCIVGDLIQGIGTVVIAAPEGDMRAYFETLEKVIALDPAVILPSHGPALGGTHYLRAALEHRRRRERQILDLHRRGADEDRILAEVYAGTPPPLLPFARLNIQSHLAKLRAENRA